MCAFSTKCAKFAARFLNLYILSICTYYTVAPEGIWFERNTLGSASYGGTGGAPQTPENFRNFLRKLRKIHGFSLFCKIFRPSVHFSHFWTKNTNGWKSFKKILTKIQQKNDFPFFGKVVAQNRALENNTFSTTIISISRGDVPFFPLPGAYAIGSN